MFDLLLKDGTTKTVSTKAEADTLVSLGMGTLVVPTNGATTKPTFDKVMPIDAAAKETYRKIRTAQAERAIGGVPAAIVAKHAPTLQNVTEENNGDVLENGSAVVVGCITRKSRANGTPYMAIRVKYAIDGNEYQVNTLPNGLDELPDEGTIVNWAIVVRTESQSKTSFNLVA
jgi:hypothetical protein